MPHARPQSLPSASSNASDKLCFPSYCCVHTVLCTSRTIAQFTPSPDGSGRQLRTGFDGICIEYGCLDCVVRGTEKYFTCALTCAIDRNNVECIDCSYTYDNSHLMLLRLRDRLWEAYFLHALDDYALDDMLNANFTTCATSGRRCLSMRRYEQLALGIDDEPSFLNTGKHPRVEEEDSL